jgi:hypothetical protein
MPAAQGKGLSSLKYLGIWSTTKAGKNTGQSEEVWVAAPICHATWGNTPVRVHREKINK